MIDESVVRALTSPGLCVSATMATMTAAIVARPVVVPFTLMKPQTPVPLRSFPVATAITESIAVLMDQKMTISGAAATRGAATHGVVMADDCARIAPRATGVTEKAWAGVSARATSATTDKLDWCIVLDSDRRREIANERTKRLSSFKVGLSVSQIS